jgi:putative Mg2+ transporter-C (MgtC) family protein
MDYSEVLLRLGAATAVGAVIGFDREIRGKPAGLRTVMLVALGAAIFVLLGETLTATSGNNATASVIQGIITGIGFLGAGTIIRGQDEESVKGLTTAASIWLAAATGVACGIGQWPILLVAIGLGLLTLLLDPVEEWLKARFTR